MARKSRKNTIDVQNKETMEEYRTALYVRLSIENSGKDDRGDSIDNQKEICMEYIRTHPDLSLTGIYEDNGKKGTSMDRPELNHMMEDIRAGRINCVLVKDLSRFSRNYLEAGRYLEKIFPFLGVRFISVTDHFDSLHAGKDENGLVVPLKNMLNAAYAKDISRKIITSFRARQEKSMILPSFVPYGYIKSQTNAYRLEIDPEAAPNVKLLFRWKLEGKSSAEMVRMLTEMGVDSPGKHKYKLGILHHEKYANSRWEGKTIQDILKNPTYTGAIVYGRIQTSLYQGIPRHKVDQAEYKVFPNMHEPIVSQELFDQVQEVIRKNRTKREEHMKNTQKMRDQVVDLFHQKIICGECGKRMRFTKFCEGKKVRSIYACSKHIASGSKDCIRNMIHKEEVDQAVYAALMEQFQYFLQLRNAAGEMSGIKAFFDRNKALMATLKRKIDQIEQKRIQLYESSIEQGYTGKEYINKKKKYDSEYELLSSQLEGLRKKDQEARKILHGDSRWLPLLEKIQNGKQLSKEMVENLIEKVIIYEGKKVEVCFRFAADITKLEQMIREIKEDFPMAEESESQGVTAE